MIHFADHVFKPDIFYAELVTRLLQLICRDVSTAIFVEVLEGGKKMVLLLNFVEVQRGCYELSVIYGATVVNVSLREYRSEKQGLFPIYIHAY